jgi:hypothetical protein
VADSELSLRYGLGGPGFEFQWRQEIFLFSKKIKNKKSRPALGAAQPPAQWVPGPFLGVKRPGCEVGHSPPSSGDVKNQ